MEWNKIAAVGDFETVFPLKAIGLEVFPIKNSSDAPQTLRKLATCGEYGVIFITENILEQTREVVSEFADKDIPAIIVVPSITGSEGLALSIVRETMKRAAGRDIMSEE